MSESKQKVMLCILDGWGIRDQTESNGIAQAHAPHWQNLWQNHPHTTLQASELFVGLPEGQMGNSEVGHMTIGSGRVIMQELPRINQAIEQGVIPTIPQMKRFVTALKQRTNKVHLIGLLSPGGVHSHQGHILYFAKYLASQSLHVYIHAFLDGRDTPPQSGIGYLDWLLAEIKGSTNITLASVGGRYFGMDRDKRWERIETAYHAMVTAKAPHTNDPVTLVQKYYDQGIGDEFIPHHIIDDYPGMQDGDGLLMVNFRADRLRQILVALLMPDFDHFPRPRTVQFAAAMGMSEYAVELTPYIPALFEKQSLDNTLGEVISHAGLQQLRAAETEKYAHVTFFLNGGRELVFPGEDRLLVASPKVATYDLQPEMSAFELTEKLVEAIHSQKYDLIVTNFANPDMVGHTGIPEAIIQAVNAVDQCLGRLQEACQQEGYALMITADHGNVEQMVDEFGHPHTAHTLNPVPFVLFNAAFQVSELRTGGLHDIAPTILRILGVPLPTEMTGQSLVGSSLN
jgi:2,3-bisphosphoglycerate-independent phosphoglycerate mutase